MSSNIISKIKSPSLKCPSFYSLARLKRKRYHLARTSQLIINLINSYSLWGQETSEPVMDLTKEVNIIEHLYSLEELCQKLDTNLEKGLSQSEAEARHKKFGPNAFSPPKQTPGWVLYLREMTTGFAIIIWLASIASFICYALETLAQDVSCSDFFNQIEWQGYYDSIFWELSWHWSSWSLAPIHTLNKRVVLRYSNRSRIWYHR